MKSIYTILKAIIFMLLPAFLFSQYSGGEGRGDFSKNSNIELLGGGEFYNHPFNTGFRREVIVGSTPCKYYDTGGPNANYPNNQNNANTYITFLPEQSLGKIRATFTQFSTEATFDALYVWDGLTSAAPKIASNLSAPIANNFWGTGGWWGTIAPNNVSAGVVEATSFSGALTFGFVSDGSVVAPGWTATIERIVDCNDPQHDITPPEINNCVANQNLILNANCAAIAPNLISSLEYKDNCTPFQDLTVVQSIAPGTVLMLSAGDTEVISLTVSDQQNNSSICLITLTAVDISVPVVLTKNLTVSLDQLGIAQIDPTDIDSNSLDNCGITSLALSRTQFDCDDLTTGTQDWLSLGTGISNGTSAYNSIVTGPDGTLYIAYKDGANSDRSTVKKWVNNAWEDVGSPGFGGTDYQHLAFSPDGTLHITFANLSNGLKAGVMKWNGTAWQYVGNSGISDGGCFWTRLAFAPDGTPYVAYRDLDVSSKTTVKRFDGANWVTVGQRGFSDGSSGLQDIVVDENLNLFIAYEDYANASKITVMRWDGANWSPLGGPGFTSSAAGTPSIRLLSNGELLIAYRLDAIGGRVEVRRWNGSEWLYLGPSNGISNGAALFTYLALDAAETPYVAYQDGTQSNKLSVIKWNGAIWEPVLNWGITSGQVSFVRMTIDKNGNPAVVYQNNANGNRAGVVRLSAPYQTVTLTATDASGNSASATARVTVLRAEDTPSVVCPENMNVSIDHNCNAVTIPSVIPDFICGSPAQFPGFTFTQEPAEGSSQSAAKGQNITLTVTADDGNGNTATCQTTLTVIDDTPPHVITQNLTLTLDENGQANITAEDIDNGSSDNCGIASMSLNRTQFDCDDIISSSQRQWQAAGNYGISASTAFYQTIAADEEGNLYVAYQDYSTPGNKITVQKWNGVSWTALGGAGSVSIGGAGNTEIKISPSGEPHVVLIDGGVNSKARLVKWNGASWEAIGNPAGISAFNVGWTTFDFDASGMPYVAYRDFANGEKTTVLKWNGTDWIALGGPGISQGFAEKQSIAVSQDGTPYVAYRDIANANKLTVLRWNGSTWSALGGVGISQGGVDFPHVMVGTDGNPIVAYTDQANGERLTVLKWNGTTWMPLGAVGFTPGGALHPKMAFNSNNELHVTFRNNNNGGRAALMKWDGNTWSFVGPVSASPGASLWNHMTFGPLDQPYLTYTDYANGTKTSVSKLSDDFQTVVLTVTDESGNVSTKAAKVVVEDNLSPSFTCPENQTINIQANIGGCQIQIPSFLDQVDASDNCSYTLVQNPSPNALISSSHEQEILVALTATDQVGNSTTCNITITALDSSPPLLSCPHDVEVSLDANCNLMIPGVQNPDQFPISFSPQGEGLVYSIQGNNLSGGYYFSLTNITHKPLNVTGFGIRFGDPQYGQVSAPQTIRIYSSTSVIFPEDLGQPEVTDSSQWTNRGSAIILSIPAHVTSGNFNSIGYLAQALMTTPMSIDSGQTVSFHVFGETACPIFNFFGSQPPVEGESWRITGGNIGFGLLSSLFFPTQNCTPNIQIYTTQNISAFDNCGLELIQDPVSGTVVASGHDQEHIISFTASDAAGNSVTCSYTITAIDNTPPAITCPSNQTLMLEEGCEVALPDYTETADATDNCSFPSVVQTPAPGTMIFTPGPVSVFLQATDENNQSSSCTFIVNADDGLSDPICPENLAFCTGEQAFTLEGATPLEGVYSGPGVDNGIFNPAAMGEGIYIITYSSIGLTGCERSCTFTIELSAELCCPPGSNTPPSTWYEDADDDGYGNPANSVRSCEQPEGFVNNNEDCDDSDQNINPAASELCNGVDDDCNGVIDEGCVVVAVKGLNQLYIENGNEAVSPLDGTLMGSASLNGSVTRSFTIFSEGVYNLLLNGDPIVQLTGPDANLFAISQNPTAGPIAPNGSSTFSVTYLGAPTYGYREATVVIPTNDYFNDPFTFVVGASTSGGRLQVRGNGITIANADLTPATNDLSDFGTVNFNSNRSRTFNIHNIGAQNLVLIGSPLVKITGPNADKFVVTLQPVSPITPSQFKQFSIRFDATAVGEFNANVEIESEDQGASPYIFAIKATVASPNMQLRYNSISGAIIENGDQNPTTTKGTDFGVRALNTTRTHSFYIRNLNGGILLLNGNPRVYITGPGASMFSVTSIPVGSIAAGSSSLMRIAYKPTAYGTHNATVSISNNQPDKNPYTFSVVGSTPNARPINSYELEPDEARLDRDERSISVYPNPLSDWVYIEISGLDGFADAMILDNSGKTIRTLRVQNGIQLIETVTLLPGEYILKLLDERYPTMKIIKQ
jgi:hypothetical protein